MRKKRGRPVLPPEPCMTAGCDRVRGAGPNTRGARGVCKRCYSAYAYLVKKGETTWGELERQGLVLKKSLPFRKRFPGGVPWGSPRR